ncbi:MAG: SGNH/GDSL hydrolase family protein [Candidatus Saccharimonadales bacterium]
MSLIKIASLIFVVVLVATLLLIIKPDKSIPNSRHTGPAVTAGNIGYLPLGDSYTIGERLKENERWPNQLTANYQPNGHKLQILANPAVTGYTTQNLIDKELPLVDSFKPDFVSVQIGVNDFVQGVDGRTFQKNFDYILTSLQQKLRLPSNIIVVTIPDFGKTQTGSQFGSPDSSTDGILKFNKIIKTVASSKQIAVADIFPVSQKVIDDPSLTSNDGLHPSSLQYQYWTNIIRDILAANNLPKLK